MNDCGTGSFNHCADERGEKEKSNLTVFEVVSHLKLIWTHMLTCSGNICPVHGHFILASSF